MITIKSHDDLNKLKPNDPAYPVMQELTELLIDAYTWDGHPYLPDDYGYLVLIEEADVDKIALHLRNLLLDMVRLGLHLPAMGLM